MSSETSRNRRNVLILAIIVLAGVLLVALVLCRGDGETTSEQTHGGAQPGVETTMPPSDAEEGTEEPSVEITQVAVLATSKGVMKLEFYPDVAPEHVANFIKLAEDGFYDGQKWHRVVPGFVIQAGDPQTKDVSAAVVQRVADNMAQAGDPPIGTGGPGYSIDAEFNSRPHLRGTLSMARSNDPDSAGSQFYICIAAQPGLDGQYTVFGQVVEGDDVIDKIQVGDSIESVKIVPRDQ